MQLRDELITRLVARNPGGPPGEQQVLLQGFASYREQWSKRWPKSPAVPRPPVLDSDNQKIRASRADLFLRAGTVTTESDALDLYLRMCSWGVGTQARGVARSAKPLQQDDVASHLLATHGLVRAGDVIGAYRSLLRGGKHYVKGFGASFFTKWLYFSGYEAPGLGGAPRPLILDARVGRALRIGTSGWKADVYAAYLDVAEQVRALWCPESSVHVVEYALFHLGRA